MLTDAFPDVIVKRTRRTKSSCLRVVDGKVQILVPQFLTDQQIFNILNKQSAWIHDQLAQYHHRQTQIQQFGNGSKVLLLGKPYVLKVRYQQGSSVKINVDDTQGIIEMIANSNHPMTSEQLREYLTIWLFNKASACYS